MEVGDRILAPAPGKPLGGSWISATVIELERHRTIRDPSDGSTYPHQLVRVRYDDGSEERWDLYLLLRRQS